MSAVGPGQRFTILEDLTDGITRGTGRLALQFADGALGVSRGPVQVWSSVAACCVRYSNLSLKHVVGGARTHQPSLKKEVPKRAANWHLGAACQPRVT